MSYPRVASLKTKADFCGYVQDLGISLPFDDVVESGPTSPLGRVFQRDRGIIGNRFCILPMEGWDGTDDGRPSELTRRRWQNFGLSGAKLIWGGEAVAVRFEGRANPQQLVLNEETLPDIVALNELLQEMHRQHFSTTDDLLVGLQLTHSGRFCRPKSKQLEPKVLYRHPLLDARFGVKDDSALMTDDDVERLIADFIKAARLAAKAGFAFVDVKHCHGYLGHEFLSAVDRPGRFGGSLENRTRFLREIVAGIRAEAPGLEVGVRLSVFDFVPFRPGDDAVGVPAASAGEYPYAFGGDGSGLGIDLSEPLAFLDLIEGLGIRLVCTTAGSPYYNPHIQRPATFPPSDGYQPPEDPLVGVARQIEATAQIKAERPKMIVVGSGYSYLQDWLPNVAQSVVRGGGADFVGLGRMVLSYPDLPADVLAGRVLARKRICRTFSDCTTAPRNGIVSGCYPLDPFYKDRPERAALNAAKNLQAGDPGRTT
ncbi:NADH:flavin oxidoreductase [Singulisphaera sp. PoT]|uniref:oxidoreductase n=1 Tax=Singulisphaera sp. PoT TaxID=3411797 RepID=UPI003BF532B8